MKKIVSVLVLLVACLGFRAIGAISVGPNGSGTLTFNALPAAGDWSTLLNTGGSGDIMDAAGLDTAVGTNVANAITTELGSSGTTAPAISSASIARWNSTLQAVQTVPTTAGYVSLLATLRNDTGREQSALTFSYDFTENHATGGTNANAVVEEVPGHRVYFSLTGAPGSWNVIPEVSSIGTTGTLVGHAELGAWGNGSLLYLLWADDNANADRNNTNNEEGGYLIDNITFKAGIISSAISVGAAGSSTMSFSSYPNVLEGWFTHQNEGANGDIVDEAGLDAAVQTNEVAAFTRQLGSSATVNPSISSSALARWNTTLGLVETVATGAGYVSLLAKLRNDSGADQPSLSLVYEFNELHADGTTVVEEVPGHRVFYSLTGTAGSWSVIPELSSVQTPGTLSATLNLGSWPAGSPLYVLWADDNANATRNDANTEEGGYTIDNVSFSFGAISGVKLASPNDGQIFPQGVPINLSALVVLPGIVTDVSFFDGPNLIGSDSAAPFSAVLSNATRGAHSLKAIATDDQGNISTSPIVGITVVPNNPPTITLTAPANGEHFFVGTNVTCTATASDADGAIARVEFYVDGGLLLTDATSPYTFTLGDITAASHTISAVAVDNGGFRGTNSVSITGTNPPNLVVIIPNGSAWKYLDDGSDQAFFWISPFFDDTGWSNGVAEFGYGDAAGNSRPERTVVGFGPDANNKFPTTYFRKVFNLPDPTAYSDYMLRLLRDDGAIVYINGAEVLRSAITNETVDFATYTPPAVADDGAIYQEIVLTAFELSGTLVPGENTIAVEIHQDAPNSSDISFDLMLWGILPAGPTLTITPTSGTTADIAWPFPSAGYVLESKADLNAASWTLVTELDVPDGSSHHVNVNTSSGARFFRLRQP